VENLVETVEKTSLIEALSSDGVVPERLVGIFVKQPIPGRVKTRLCPPLTPEEAARLYEVAMRECVARLVEAGITLVVFYSGEDAYFRRSFPDLPRLPQSTGDLGERMRLALTTLLATGCRSAALVGSDSPDLPVDQIEGALAALNSSDAVTVPADDGGYVLVGLSRPAPQLFRDIPWSTAGVLSATRRRGEEAGLRYREIGGWHDLDDLDSLRDLLARTPDSVTGRHIRRHLGHRL